MAKALEKLLEDLPARCERLRELREILLANAVLVGEIPAPTFGEDTRMRFVMDRFNECGCQNISQDEAGNAVGIIQGGSGNNATSYQSGSGNVSLVIQGRH